MRLLVWLAVLFGASGAFADDLEWSVVNPFRAYRNAQSFQLHRDAYAAILRENGGVRPADIVTRLERRLNDPVCANAATYDSCAKGTAPSAFERSRSGWAARSIDDLCYVGRKSGGFGY